VLVKELTDRALEKAQSLGASYADIRIVNRQNESLQVKNGKVEGLSSAEDEGFGIRVIADGAWGFASSLNLDPDEIDSVAEMAVRIAQASSQVRHPVCLKPTVITLRRKGSLRLCSCCPGVVFSSSGQSCDMI
jgi:TldD protein